MKFKKLVLFGLLLSCGVLNAQTDFRPGYIIKTIGDTIFGQIDYRGDIIMSSLCKFKDVHNTIIEYSPNDIEAFRFLESKYYVTKVIDNKKAFLEYLIKGKINIYYMRDEKGDHYYLDKEDVELTEIPYEEGIEYVDNKRVFYNSKKHIGLLIYCTQDDPDLIAEIRSIKKPEHQNLIKLAEDYHNAVCNDEKCIIYEKRLPLLKISMLPYVGLAKYKGWDKFINELGGYLYIWAPRTNENIYFKTGLVYHKIFDTSTVLKIYKIPIQIQYIYRAKRIQPKLSGGFDILSLKLNKYNDDYFYNGLIYTFCLNTGLDYKISNKIYLSTAFNTDITPPIIVSTNEDLKFHLISYSMFIGFRIDI